MQYRQYDAQRQIFLSAPTTANEASTISFRELVEFVAHVADCYPTECAEFPQQLIEILARHHTDLESELCEKIVGSLVLLRKKDLIDSSVLLHTLFPILTSTPRKTLRALVFQKILSDLRQSNSKGTNHKLNRTVQTVLFNIVTADRTSTQALWAVKLTRELWKRHIWTESKAVEVMKECCLADNEKVVAAGVRFFLGGDKEREELEESSDDEDAIDMGKIKHQMGVNKKTKKRAKALEQAAEKVKRKEKKKNQPHPLNFSAFHLLNDPQGFTEVLFSKHLQNTKSKLRLEQKLQVLQLATRLVGLHKLTILSLYSWFVKYLTPKQHSVTSFLASLAQGTHNLVPPDVLEPLIQKIANEFVSEASAAEVASAGLNAIREICVRQPLAMNESLLKDLVMYKKSKDKGVVMAARGLLALYRDVNPEMLSRKDRGKDATIGIRSGEHKEQRFGEEKVGEIDGLDLLEKWKEEERARKQAETGIEEADGEEEEDDAAWEVESNSDSDDSGGWINVGSDDEIEISDSEDERPRTKKAKTEASSEGTIPAEDKENAAELEKRISTLAMTKILTPADLAKLQELRLEASLNKALPTAQRKRLAAQAALQNRHVDDPLTATEIEGLAALSKKATREDKIAKAKEGKGERGEYKSTKAVKQATKQASGKSTTNKEKARKKNFLMTLGKAKGKSKRSLVDKSKVLRAHKEREKRGGRRGNY